MEKCASQVFGKAHCGNSAESSGKSTEAQRNDGHSHHEKTHSGNIADVALLDTVVDDQGHNSRYQHLHGDLAYDRNRRENGLLLVLTHI